jgi:glycine/serine hydroxymethyltransferase
VNWIDKILMNVDNEEVAIGVKGEINEFMTRFPLYPNWKV